MYYGSSRLVATVLLLQTAYDGAAAQFPAGLHGGIAPAEYRFTDTFLLGRIVLRFDALRIRRHCMSAGLESAT
jgi:hypothetical protein